MLTTIDRIYFSEDMNIQSIHEQANSFSIPRAERSYCSNMTPFIPR